MELKKLTPWNWFKHEQPTNQALTSRGRSGESEHPLAQFHRGIDSLFDELLENTRALQPLGETDAFFRPDLDIAANDKHYQINLEVPGLKRDDVSVDVSGDTLTIRGHKSEQTRDEDKHYVQIERRYGDFQRTLALPDDADPDHVQAQLENGVLHLTVPRTEHSRSNRKRIDIN